MDRFDLAVMAGCGIVACGIGLLSVPAALIFVGIVTVAGAVAVARTVSTKGPGGRSDQAAGASRQSRKSSQ